MVWNSLSVLPAMIAIKYIGRRTLFMITQLGMAICLLGVWVMLMKNWNTGAIFTCAGYLFMFEIGLGSLFWLYLAEICNNKAMAVATAY